ncbi:hypothetical protein [Maridesulfovibrio sp. FT414]|uniref:hypothetical protein n=1 Tax=Maridesulfovibrio sp. FT414 TaxID=2979469 RepID=UPI003D8042E4
MCINEFSNEVYSSVLGKLGLNPACVEQRIRKSGCGEKERFNITMPVWGREYVIMFLDTALPCILADNNLPYIAKNADVNFDIYVPESDVSTLKNSRSFELLSSLCSVRIFVFSDSAVDDMINNYTLMALCHTLELQISKREGATVVFLCPDIVISNGGLKLIYEKFLEGYKAVLGNSVRLVKETGLGEFHNEFGSGEVIKVDSAALVRFGLNHLHPQVDAVSWDGSRKSPMSCGLVWNVPGEGLILKSFQWHPFAVRADAVQAKVDTVIDSSLFSDSFLSMENTYLITDSSEFSYFEFSPGEMGSGGLGRENSLTLNIIAEWAKSNTSMLQHDIFKSNLLLHCGMHSHLWDAKLEDVAVVEREIFMLMGLN